MFKLNKLSAVIAIGLGSALPVQAGLLDDLIGAKFNPISSSKGVAPEGQKGSFTKPFSEPFVYERSVANDNNSTLQGFRTDNKCEGIGANGKLRCKPAAGTISMLPATFDLVEAGNHKKGDVLGIARIAGIQASKKTSDLIPLCHPLALSHVSLQFELDRASHSIRCQVQAETTGPTGVEMEALTAVQVALLTIYDMCKAVDRGMVMSDIKLLEKSGGKSGEWKAS